MIHATETKKSNTEDVYYAINGLSLVVISEIRNTI